MCGLAINSLLAGRGRLTNLGALKRLRNSVVSAALFDKLSVSTTVTPRFSSDRPYQIGEAGAWR
jgi:hypothetical protein